MLKNALNYIGVPTGGSSGIPETLNKKLSTLPNWEKENYIHAYHIGIVRDGQDLFTYKSNKATKRKDTALLIYRLLGAVDFK